MSDSGAFSIQVAYHGVCLAPGARFRILVDDAGLRIVPDPHGTCVVEACESRIVRGIGRRLIVVYRKPASPCDGVGTVSVSLQRRTRIAGIRITGQTRERSR